MKQTIEIEVPDGKKAVWKDGTIVFKDTKPQFPKTWEEFCKQNKVKIQTTGQHLALMQLHQLRDCYRQGWTPDYTDVSNKFCIIRSFDYFYYFNSKLYTYIYEVKTYNTVSHFLSFQSKEIAEKFLNNFKNLIKQAGDLI